jgi:hypothetical protein
MIEQVKQTLNAVRQQMLELRELEGALERFIGPGGAPAAVAVETVAPTAGKEGTRDQRPETKDPEKRNGDFKGRGTRKVTRSKAEPGRRTRIEDYCGPIRGLKEPFGNAEIAESCGVTQKNATNISGRLTRLGWLARVGFGDYQRTPKFPAGSGITANSQRMLEEIHREEAGKAKA